MYEDVDFDKDQGTQGVKFTISSINWTMCRPDKDDYNASVSRLIQHLKDRGEMGMSLMIVTSYIDCIRYRIITRAMARTRVILGLWLGAF